jgi:carboxyl-terminal processing protease
MKTFFTKQRIRIAIATSFVVVFSVAFSAFKDNNFEIAKNLDIYYTLFRELNLYYVDETDPGDLVKTSIDKMLENLDPYTVYIPESKMEDYNFMTTGQYGGIGALIRKTDDYVIITDPYEGYPADKAGLKAGDKIVEIDGVELKGKDSADVSELLKGQPNTVINIKIHRPGTKKEIEKTITREKIKVYNVPYYGMLENKIGYIRLSNFTSKASKEVKDALIDLKNNQGAESIIVDLRGNPGGLLIESVNITNLFVNKGQEIVSTKGKAKQWDRTYNASFEPIDTAIPLVVLVNRGSASASEIVSGAIQDLDRGVIIGTRTFGKGLVQTTRPLSYNSKLKVTTAKYYIPSGRCIQALDYSNRNDDGSVGTVPDSLISEFQTKNNRTVFDGGGIIPDIETEAKRLSKIAISLLMKNLIFDFATSYVLEKKEIASIKDFVFSDEDYKNFITFLSDKDFDYNTKSESSLNKLIDEAKKEKYFSLVESEFETLKEKLAHDKDKDLQTFKDEIKELIAEEIIGRYYYTKGKIQYALQFDPNIEKAIEVLNSEETYASILDGTYKSEIEEKTSN